MQTIQTKYTSNIFENKKLQNARKNILKITSYCFNIYTYTYSIYIYIHTVHIKIAKKRKNNEDNKTHKNIQKDKQTNTIGQTKQRKTHKIKTKNKNTEKQISKATTNKNTIKNNSK